MSTTQLSAEIVDQIENEAEDYGEKTGDTINGIYTTHQDRRGGYIEGATAYATKLVEAQERIKTLESYLDRIAIGAQPYNDREAWSWIETARQLANEALSLNIVKDKEDE